MAHLIAILIAAAAQEPRHGFHASAGTGFGTAYDVTGVRGEIGTDHLALFAGTGAMSRLVIDGTSPGASVCFGARWYSGVARAWFTSLDVTYSWAESYVNAGIQGPGAPTGPDRLLTTGATEGYRFLFSDLVFFEVGAGVGWYRRGRWIRLLLLTAADGRGFSFSCRPPGPPSGRRRRARCGRP